MMAAVPKAVELTASRWTRSCRGLSGNLAAAFHGQRRGYHIAVIGSGPGAFYTSKFFLKKGGENAKVDMFERLPTPFGLVRFGVAPDHPEVKNVINDFTAVAEDAGRFRFFGNVEVGSKVSLETLERSYDAVVLCTGAQGERKLGIPGEDLGGVIGAPAFVKWYNGHPDHQSVVDELPADIGSSAVVVGNGNVALDVARLLVRSPEELRQTDMCDVAIDRIGSWQKAGLQTVQVLGRRGLVQAAFTNKELRELLDISSDVMPIVDPEEVALSRNAASEKELATNRPKKRSLEIIDKMVANFEQRHTTSKRIVWLRFLAAPTEITASSDGFCSGLRWSRTELQGEPGKQTVRTVGAPPGSDIACGLVVRSVGFDITPMDGIPLDNRNRIPHANGRVQAGEGRNLYVAGWAKRGPQGVIASNIPDAQETALCLLKDLTARGAASQADTAAIDEALSSESSQVVSFGDWKKLQQEELSRGESTAVKLTSVADMLHLLNK